MEFCVCEHSFEEHKNNEEDGYTTFPHLQFCVGCGNAYDTKPSHTFKLDNLKLIEDLAKERNLI